jgi:hypothetical protein
MSLPFVSIVLGSHLLIAAPAGIPSVDIRKTCQAAAGTMTDLIAVRAGRGTSRAEITSTISDRASGAIAEFW